MRILCLNGMLSTRISVCFAEAVINWYYQNPQMLSSVESAVLEDQAVETVLNEAKVSEETLDYTQVMQLAAGQNQ